jgi:hypothetical protein
MTVTTTNLTRQYPDNLLNVEHTGDAEGRW